MYKTKRELELAAGYAEERVQEQLRKDSDRLTKHRVRYPNIEQASKRVQATRRRYEAELADSWTALEQCQAHYDKLLADFDDNNSDNNEGGAQAAPPVQADSSDSDNSAQVQAPMTEAAIDAIYTQKFKVDQALSNLLHSLESANKAGQRSAVESNAIEYLQTAQAQLRAHIDNIVAAYEAAQADNIEAAYEAAQADNIVTAYEAAQVAVNISDTEAQLEQAVQAGDSDTADDLRAKLQGLRLDMQDLQRAKRQEQLAAIKAVQAADDLQAVQIQRLQRAIDMWQREARFAKSDNERALYQAYAALEQSNLAFVDGSFTSEHVTQRKAIKAQVAAAQAALAKDEQGARKRPAKSKQPAPAAPSKAHASAPTKRKAVKAKAADSATKAKRAARNTKRREQQQAADKQRLAQQAMARYRKAASNADKDSQQARLAQQAMARYRKAAIGKR